jgi:hypothetical protein
MGTSQGKANVHVGCSLSVARVCLSLAGFDGHPPGSCPGTQVPGSGTFSHVKSQIRMTNRTLSCGTRAEVPSTANG